MYEFLEMVSFVNESVVNFPSAMNDIIYCTVLTINFISIIDLLNTVLTPLGLSAKHYRLSMG